MTAEHAPGIDTGGGVEALAEIVAGVSEFRPRVCRVIAHAVLTATRQTAADAVLAEARRLCCGNNPSPHHEATAKHSERMAFAGDLARAVRGL